jgi:hypothetical protein
VCNEGGDKYRPILETHLVDSGMSADMSGATVMCSPVLFLNVFPE